MNTNHLMNLIFLYKIAQIYCSNDLKENSDNLEKSKESPKCIETEYGTVPESSGISYKTVNVQMIIQHHYFQLTPAWDVNVNTYTPQQNCNGYFTSSAPYYFNSAQMAQPHCLNPQVEPQATFSSSLGTRPPPGFESYQSRNQQIPVYSYSSQPEMYYTTNSMPYPSIGSFYSGQNTMKIPIVYQTDSPRHYNRCSFQKPTETPFYRQNIANYPYPAQYMAKIPVTNQGYYYQQPQIEPFPKFDANQIHQNVSNLKLSVNNEQDLYENVKGFRLKVFNLCLFRQN